MMTTMTRRPFMFKGGQQVASVEDLVRLCVADRDGALQHFTSGHFEPWLADLGRADLAAQAAQLRQHADYDDEDRLRLFLHQTGVDHAFQSALATDTLAALDAQFSAMPDVPTLAAPGLRPVLDSRKAMRRPRARVVFFGLFKAGKSTLLNAIVGQDLLPARVNRATGVITRIGYAAHPAAHVFSRTVSGQVVEPVALNDIARYILLDLSQTVAIAPVGVDSVVVRLPLPLLHNRCVLIDTPGLLDNQALTNRTLAELLQADLAVMVVSAHAVLSEAERNTASDVHAALNGNIVFVVNRLDLVEEDEREEVVAWTTRLVEEWGNLLVGTPRIFATEAKHALRARMNGHACIDGVAQFERWLGDLFGTRAGDRVVMLSRLGRLDQALERTLTDLHTQAAALRERYKQTDVGDRARLVRQQQAFAKKMRSYWARFSALKPQVDELLDQFIETCVEQITSLMDNDEDWANRSKIDERIVEAFETYQRQVRERTDAALSTEVCVQPFSLPPDASQVDYAIAENSVKGAVVGGAIGGAVGLLFGGWGAVAGAAIGSRIGKGISGKDILGETLASIRSGASASVEKLREHTNEYLAWLEQQLRDYERDHQPAPAVSPHGEHERVTGQQIEALVDWCERCRQVVQQQAQRIAAAS